MSSQVQPSVWISAACAGDELAFAPPPRPPPPAAARRDGNVIALVMPLTRTTREMLALRIDRDSAREAAA